MAFFASAANLFFGPANNALLPQLVGEEELVSANSLDALGENVARIIGPAVGGACGVVEPGIVQLGGMIEDFGLILARISRHWKNS